MVSKQASLGLSTGLAAQPEASSSGYQASTRRTPHPTRCPYYLALVLVKGCISVGRLTAMVSFPAAWPIQRLPEECLPWMINDGALTRDSFCVKQMGWPSGSQKRTQCLSRPPNAGIYWTHEQAVTHMLLECDALCATKFPETLSRCKGWHWVLNAAGGLPHSQLLTHTEVGRGHGAAWAKDRCCQYVALLATSRPWVRLDPMHVCSTFGLLQVPCRGHTA